MPTITAIPARCGQARPQQRTGHKIAEMITAAQDRVAMWPVLWRLHLQVHDQGTQHGYCVAAMLAAGWNSEGLTGADIADGLAILGRGADLPDRLLDPSVRAQTANG